MNILISNIKWHNAREEKPKKDGDYLVLIKEHIEIEDTCFSVNYSVAADMWNVVVLPDGTVKDPSVAFEDVKWWASAEDINEVYISIMEEKDE